MKQPDRRNTTDRDEMMCPRCDTEGLEENPAYSDEYNGISEIIKATRCPNEDCDFHYGLPDNEVKRQMPENSSSSIINNLVPSELNASSIIRLCLVFGGLIFMLSQVGLLPFVGDNTPSQNDIQSNINGQITGDNVESLENLSVELINDSSGESVQDIDINDEEFRFENIDAGIYNVYVYSSELDFSPPGKQIELGEDEENLEFELSDVEQFDINQTVSNADINIDYENPHNRKDLELMLSPIEGDNIQREHDLNSDTTETILLPVEPQSEQTRVYAPIKEEEQIINNQYTDNEQTYEILGNLDVTDLRVELTNESSTDVQSQTFEVDEDTTESIFVSSEETLGEVDITLRNGTSRASEQETGVWDGERNITFFTGVDNFTTANMQIQPEQTEDNREITDEITGPTIEHNFRGNMPIDDAKIYFEGGDVNSTRVGLIDEQDNARNGTIRKEYNLATIEDDSRFRFDWDANIIENSDLVNFAYEINGEETTLDEGSDGFGIELDEDDEFNIILDLERDTVYDDENSPHFGSLDDNINVLDVSFSDSNPEPGDNIEKFATLENEASHDITEEIEFYLNGDNVASRSYTIPANSEKEIGGVTELGTTSVSEEGTNVWYVNDKGPFFLEVGNSEAVYGIGEIEAELRDIGSDGEISIDTNNDGNQDCTVSSVDGECSFDTLEPGDKNISISERNVDNTDYIIEYTELNNPRDITIDVGEDNIIDFEHDGILTSSESQNIEISPENTTMSISSENNIPIQYSVSWESDSVVDNPVVYHDGNQVISDEGTFQEPKTFQIDSLPEGENEFRFRAASGGYKADIEWVEDEGQSYPHTLINNQNVCNEGSQYATNQTCEISNTGTSPGEHTIDFDRISRSFDYQIKYNSRAVSGFVNINANDNNERFSRSSPDAETWNDVSSTSLLERGENDVSIDSETVNGISTDAEATIEYSIDTDIAQNPEIQVINDNGETNNVTIPRNSLDSSDRLIDNANISIPAEWFSAGNNTIEIRTQDGLFELNGDIRIPEDNINFKTR